MAGNHRESGTEKGATQDSNAGISNAVWDGRHGKDFLTRLRNGFSLLDDITQLVLGPELGSQCRR